MLAAMLSVEHQVATGRELGVLLRVLAAVGLAQLPLVGVAQRWVIAI